MLLIILWYIGILYVRLYLYYNNITWSGKLDWKMEQALCEKFRLGNENMKNGSKMNGNDRLKNNCNKYTII